MEIPGIVGRFPRVNFKAIVQHWAAIADGISLFLLFKIQIFECVRWLIQLNSDFIL